MLSAIRAYVWEMGVTDEFANIMMNTDPENVHTYDSNTIQELVPEQDPLYNEARVAHDARRFDLTTQEYRQRAKESLSCGTYVIPGLDDCSSAILWGLSVQTFQDRNKKIQAACISESREYSKFASSHVIGAKGNWDNPIVMNFENCERKVMRGD